MYLLAILLPPVAVLFCFKPFQMILNVILCVIGVVTGGVGYVLAIIHALMVVGGRKSELRHRDLVRAISSQSRRT
jgi:uncharacterized membrane protein YqaE (UPF0057 family)